jgi:hypothetical protein
MNLFDSGTIENCTTVELLRIVYNHMIVNETDFSNCIDPWFNLLKKYD